MNQGWIIALIIVFACNIIGTSIGQVLAKKEFKRWEEEHRKK